MKQLLLHPRLFSFQYINWRSKKFWQLCSSFYSANEAIWIQLGFETYATSCSRHQQGSINLQHLFYPCSVCLTLNWWVLSVLNRFWEIWCVPVRGRNVFLPSNGCSHPRKDNRLTNHLQSLLSQAIFDPTSTDVHSLLSPHLLLFSLSSASGRMETWGSVALWLGNNAEIIWSGLVWTDGWIWGGGGLVWRQDKESGYSWIRE